MSDQPYDPAQDRILTLGEGHLLPDDQWAAVVADAAAEFEARQLEIGGGAGYQSLGLTPHYVDVPDSYHKSSTLNRVQLYVIHTAECPLRVGFATSLTKWGNGGVNPEASWHRMVDPATVVRWISPSRAAWHATIANRISLGYEQAGYAAYPRATWTEPDGLRQIDLLGQQLVTDGIPTGGLRWLTDKQVQDVLAGRDRTTVGLCTHAQIQPKNRTDPGKGYPKDILLAATSYYRLGGKKPSGGGRFLTEDGIFDPQTIGVTQAFVGADRDGDWGPQSIAKLQHRIGTPATGRWDQRRDTAALAAFHGKPGLATVPWNYAWRTKPDPHTQALEALMNRAIRRGNFKP